MFITYCRWHKPQWIKSFVIQCLQSTWQYFDKTKCKSCLYTHKTLRNYEVPSKKCTYVAGVELEFEIGRSRGEGRSGAKTRKINNKLNPETAALSGYEPGHIGGRRVLLLQSTWPPPQQIGPEVWSRKWKPLASTLMPHYRGIYWHTLRKLLTIQHITLLLQCELRCKSLCLIWLIKALQKEMENGSIHVLLKLKKIEVDLISR